MDSPAYLRSLNIVQRKAVEHGASDGREGQISSPLALSTGIGRRCETKRRRASVVRANADLSKAIRDIGNGEGPGEPFCAGDGCVPRGGFAVWAVDGMGGFKMSIDPSGWHMDSGSPSWSAETRTFSFYLRKQGRDRVLCMVSIDALEGAVQSDSLPETALHRIFDAHRLMIELRAAQKLNAGLFEIDGSVLVSAEDI